MPETEEKTDLDFDDLAVAENYDRELVPRMFDPWADMLLDRAELRDSMAVLDLACGSGIVMRKLLQRLDGSSRIIAADISAAMLEQAKKHARNAPNVEFVVTPAEPLSIPDASVDLVICQQGFQFFPDGDAAAREMHRVLRPGGRVAIATWCEMDRCTIFGAMQRALITTGCTEAAQKQAVPFNFMPRERLEGHFAAAGFADIAIDEPERDFVVPGGMEGMLAFMYSTPIAAFLKELPDEQRQSLHREMEKEFSAMQHNGATVGKLVAHFLFARKPG